MLWSLLFLLVTTFLGLLVAEKLKALNGIAERLGVGMALGLLLQMWLPFIISRVFGIGAGPGMALGLCVLLAVGLVSAREPGIMNQKWLDLRVASRGREFRKNAGILGVLTLILGWFFYTHSLEPTAAGLCSAGVAWEDQSYHAMLASSFLWSDNLETLQYPHFLGWPLGYPFLPDLLAATLGRLGASLSEGFFLSSWYAGAAFLLLCWTLIRSWLGSGARSWLAVMLFLFAGGFGFVDFAQEILHGTKWPECLIRHDYTNGWELALHYENPLTGILLPMRTSLLGMPIALAVLLFLPRVVADRQARWSDWLTLGVMIGLLPLVHAHSFLVIGICGLVYAAFYFRIQQWWLPVLLSVVPMLLLALPQVLWTKAQLAISEPFIHVQWGWMCDAKTLGGWLGYWLHNGGLRLPLGLLSWFFAPSRVRKLTLPLLGLLLLGNILTFQPNVYDNIKFFAFTDIALAALTTFPLIALWQSAWTTRWLVFPLVLLLTASGLLSICRETQLSSTICDWDAVAFAEMVRQNTAPRSVFLTSGELTHPVPVLTGRSLVLGYTGWLGQHGVPVGERPREVREMFEGGPEAVALLQKYTVNYVVVGPSERREYPALNEDFISSQAKVRYQSGPYTLYEIKP